MNRNVNSRFALSPTVSIGRSTFKRNSSVKTSFSVSELIPFYLDEVLPGDTFKIKTSKVIRMPMFQTAPMDNLYCDFYYFYVPNRLCWEHSKEFFGENNESAWVPTTEYSTPQVTSPEGGWEVGTIADYMGVPTGIDDLSISALPFRAYALICDQWFRSTVVDDPVNIPVTDATIAGSNGDDYVTDLVKGGKPFIANKFFDLFTGCTPAPQRGNDVLIPFGDIDVTSTLSGGITGSGTLSGSSIPVFGNGLSLGLTDGSGLGSLSGLYNNIGTFAISRAPIGEFVGTSNVSGSNLANGKDWGVATKAQLGAAPQNSGLVADFAGASIPLTLENDLEVNTLTNVTAGSINQLRLAFQLQKWYERLAIGGDRYIEIIKSMFGVTSPDARLQRTEYLGGNRLPITINQVIQTSATGSTPQGTPTGQSLTVDSHYDFTKSFTEHGLILGVCVARYDHSYQQGLDRLWTRKDKFDYYWPLLANIGNQAINNSRIYCQGSSVIDEDTDKPYDDEVFGYQEAWAEYRYKPNMITGQMRSSYAQSLDVWHFGDDYESMPYLSSEWMKEDMSNVDRTLATGSGVGADQLFADFYIENTTTRPMPLYSLPGLIDHH